MTPFTLTASNFRVLRELSAEFRGITLVNGKNGDGKTSLIEAIRATTGHFQSLGVKKGVCGQLISTGAANGGISLATENGATDLRLQTGEISSTGAPVSLGRTAAGLSPWSRSSRDDRSKALAETIAAQPSIDDLRAALTTATLSGDAQERFEKWLASLWSDIQARGWDSEHKKYDERGRDIKASWRAVTGVQWGSVKAESWQPRDWSHDLAGMSPESLDAIVVAAEAELEHAVGAAAVSGADRARLQAIVDESAAGADIEGLSKAIDAVDQEIDKARAELAALPVATGSNTGNCPHEGCGRPVLVTKDASSGRVILRKSDKPPATQDEISSRMAAEKEISGRIGSLAKQREYHVEAWRKRNAEIENAAKSAAELTKPAAGPAADVDAKRRAVTLAKAQRDAWKAKTEADRLHREVGKNQRIIDALSPSGVRKTALVRGLAAINGKLGQFCGYAEWPLVEISSDLVAEFDGRSFGLSRGETMRADIVIQCVLAKLSGDSFVIIDDAEAISGLKGLLQAMHRTGMAGLIAMKEDNPARVPQLPPQIGRTIRLEKGRIVQ